MSATPPTPSRVTNAALIACLATAAFTGCVTGASPAAQPNASTQPPLAKTPTGTLIVYSATYAPTLEQGEYPVHTNYTIATPDDKVTEHVKNATGPFTADPARVLLPTGEYHVRAQYDGGGFVVVPVSIEPDKTTVIDLDGEHLSQQLPGRGPFAHGPIKNRERVTLPNGQTVGWRATMQ
jgi:hypothetical protein